MRSAAASPEGIPLEEALRHLVAESGTQFDPKIVEYFKRLPVQDLAEVSQIGEPVAADARSLTFPAPRPLPACPALLSPAFPFPPNGVESPIISRLPGEDGNPTLQRDGL